MGDDEYPAPLLHLAAPPAFLFVRGVQGPPEQVVVAIVGTRNCTRSAERIARTFAAELAAAGACVLSGLARGVDCAAHKGALSVGGFTCAVIGTGIDLVYPAGHAMLQDEIATRGLLISEMPLGARPHGGSFPKRNRIIAALASVVIVVEAPVNSGALSTAKQALDLGRTVAAVPGNIDSPPNTGSNRLLRDGAHVLLDANDAVTLAGLSRAKVLVASRDLSPSERKVLNVIGERTLTTEQIVSASEMPIQECLSAIGSLELDGLLESTITGELQRRHDLVRAAGTHS
jgi:DNA processing protein